MSVIVNISRKADDGRDVEQEYLINTRDFSQAALRGLETWIDHGHANHPYQDSPIIIRVFDHEIGE